MAKVEIQDDCFAPRRTRWVEYAGPDPFAFYREGRNILRPVFEIGTSSTGEPRFMWDWTGDPVQLYVHWLAKRSYSAFTTMWFSCRCVGFKAKSKNEGTFRMEIEPTLRHNIKGSRLVIFFWWMYWYLFYNRARQGMLERCKDQAERFMNVIKTMYHLGTFTEETI